MSPAPLPPSSGRIVALDLDPLSLRRTHSFIDAERAAAIRDLLADNHFAPAERGDALFRLVLSVAEDRLVFDIRDEQGAAIVRHILPLTPLRRVVKDYFLVCDAYYRAAGGIAARIEAMDMGRRALHNEGASLLQESLAGRIAVDFPTARRLFTLVCSLHWKG